jgi:DNA mismatch endonuclease (patch repair protein)
VARSGHDRRSYTTSRDAIFVHGCFWHRHGCKRGALPASNIEFWYEKLERNRRRDREVVKALKRGGWKVMVVWECETRNAEAFGRRLDDFLSDAATP